jgi:anti-anti-sigma factor
MQYKTELKEKFTVLTILENSISSNLVPELAQIITKIGAEAPKNLVLNLGQVSSWDLPVISYLAEAQGNFYMQNTSFVICCLSNSLEVTLDLTDFADTMNITPTESEAWDILQMEEIERELLDSDDMEFSNQE